MTNIVPRDREVRHRSGRTIGRQGWLRPVPERTLALTDGSCAMSPGGRAPRAASRPRITEAGLTRRASAVLLQLAGPQGRGYTLAAYASGDDVHGPLLLSHRKPRVRHRLDERVSQFRAIRKPEDARLRNQHASSWRPPAAATTSIRNTGRCKHAVSELFSGAVRTAGASWHARPAFLTGQSAAMARADHRGREAGAFRRAHCII